MHKDWTAIIDALKSQNWLIEQTSGGHTKALDPSGAHIVVFATSSDDQRAMRNALSDLRKRGFVWPPAVQQQQQQQQQQLVQCPICKAQTFNTRTGSCTRAPCAAEPPKSKASRAYKQDINSDDERRAVELFTQGFGLKQIAERIGLEPTRSNGDRVRRVLQIARVYQPKYTKTKPGAVNLKLLRALKVAAALQQPFHENDLLRIAWPTRKPENGVRSVMKQLRRKGAVRDAADGYWRVTEHGFTLAEVPPAPAHMVEQPHPVGAIEQPAAPEPADPGPLPPFPVAPYPPPPWAAAPPPWAAAPPPWAAAPPPPPMPEIARELTIMQMLSELDSHAQERIAQWLGSRVAQGARRR